MLTLASNLCPTNSKFQVTPLHDRHVNTVVHHLPQCRQGWSWGNHHKDFRRELVTHVACARIRPLVSMLVSFYPHVRYRGAINTGIVSYVHGAENLHVHIWAKIRGYFPP